MVLWAASCICFVGLYRAGGCREPSCWLPFTVDTTVAAVCCSVLQCIAVRCSIVTCVAVYMTIREPSCWLSFTVRVCVCMCECVSVREWVAGFVPRAVMLAALYGARLVTYTRESA